MLKSIFLVTSMLVAIPAFAQDSPEKQDTSAQTQPAPADQKPVKATDDAAPDSDADQTATQPTPNPPAATQGTQPTPSQPPQSAQPAPATDPTAPAPTPAQPQQPVQPDTAAAPAQPAEAQPATTSDQVAQAVSRDFGTYDKDANGMLSEAEFGEWMAALRKAVEPGFTPGTPEAQSWQKQAFASADTDKNASINRGELTTFLTPKQAS